MNRRHLALAAALITTLVATYLAPEPGTDVVSVRAETGAQAERVLIAPDPALRRSSAGNGLALLEIKRRIPEEDEAVIFSQVSWAPPASKIADAPKEAPPPPQAPPLPFKVLGQYSEDGAEGVFLQLNDQYLVVREGDTINGTYKIAGYKNGSLEIVYLPLNQHQTLVVSRPE